jgi:hypothetical protein
MFHLELSDSLTSSFLHHYHVLLTVGLYILKTFHSKLFSLPQASRQYISKVLLFTLHYSSFSGTPLNLTTAFLQLKLHNDTAVFKRYLHTAQAAGQTEASSDL